MKPIQKCEYRIRVVNSKGSCFVANAFQSDVNEALRIYHAEKNSLMNLTQKAKVWIEKVSISTTIEDFTSQADNMLKNS